MTVRMRGKRSRILYSLEPAGTCRGIPIAFPGIILFWERAWMVLQKNLTLFLFPVRKVAVIKRSEILGERKGVPHVNTLFFTAGPVRRPA